ncbi:hypothetical protein GPA27_26745 [Aromatoleum toluolicum]|uniref:Integrase n=1 Tax=Aromatoleum toluolicum TaxID=90060 RepID=A0ABX1NNV2_9RHOO|nr:hypothetical protein [Aromatoleum toluolicum]NMG00977.1 hypothetical protein [Aromatoleum toluolicum]
MAGRKRRDVVVEAPIIDPLPETDRRKPYPLSRAEQKLLLSELDADAAGVALYLLNSRVREQEACKLEWDWEVRVPELDANVFVVADFGGRDDVQLANNRAGLSGRIGRWQAGQPGASSHTPFDCLRSPDYASSALS